MRQLREVRPNAPDQEIVDHLERALGPLRAACDATGAKDEALEDALLLLINALRRYRALAAPE